MSLFRVGFVGAPGCRKTTTARALTGRLRDALGISTIELVDEYARKYISKHGKPTVSSQLLILDKQTEAEDAFPKDHTEVLVTDSPIFLGLYYAIEGRNLDDPQDTACVNALFEKMMWLNSPQRYDVIFHLPPVVDPVKDGVRPAYQFNPTWREDADRLIYSLMKIFPPKHLITVNTKDNDERVELCIEAITKIYNKK